MTVSQLAKVVVTNGQEKPIDGGKNHVQNVNSMGSSSIGSNVGL